MFGYKQGLKTTLMLEMNVAKLRIIKTTHPKNASLRTKSELFFDFWYSHYIYPFFPCTVSSQRIKYTH